MRSFYIPAAAIILLLTFACCVSEGEADNQLFVGLERVSVKMNEPRYLTIFSGGGDYEAVPQNDRILSAEVSGNEIKLIPKIEGTTKVTVTDRLGQSDEFLAVVERPYLILNFENRNERFQIDVADDNMRSRITNELKAENFAAPDTVYIFRAGGEKTVEVYRDNNFMKAGVFKKSGTYSFLEEGAGVVFYYGDDHYEYTALTPQTLEKFKAMDSYLSRSGNDESVDAADAKGNYVSNNVEAGCDFTEKYMRKYPEAGVKTAIVAYTGTLVVYKDF